jgi:guanylate cyclase
MVSRLREGISRYAFAGTLPDQPLDERLRRATLTIASTAVSILAIAWVITYSVVGIPAAAIVAAAYQVTTAVGIVILAKTKRFAFLRLSQLVMMLLFPFLIHVSLGGFVASSAVVVWAIQAPLGVVMFEGARRGKPWFLTYAALLGLAGGIEQILASRAPEIPSGIIVGFFVMNILGFSAIAFLALQFFVRERERVLKDLEAEQTKSEQLLRQLLPEPIVQRLKENADVIAERFHDATVLVADMVGFTKLTRRTSPERLVSILDRVFSAFDRLVEVRGLEKIKTVGDAYLVVGGFPEPRDDHPEAVAELALEMLAEIEQVGEFVGEPLALRIGIDTGPVVAGVIGKSRFVYDVWGETVNMAHLMQQSGVPGKVQVTPRTHERLQSSFRFTKRRLVRVKGARTMTSYVLVGRREPAAVGGAAAEG